MEKNMSEKEVNDEDFDDEDFFEEYGEELTESFINFCIHFAEYVAEMNEEISEIAYEYAHSFLDEYGLKAELEDDEIFYSMKDQKEENNLAYGIISIQMKFQDKVKELDFNLWDRAIQYSADYGGVGRVKFFHLKNKKKKEDENDDGNSEYKNGAD